MVYTFLILVGAHHIKESKMPITIDVNDLLKVIEAIKQLPVKCDDFDTADRWVGIILLLEKLASTTEPETNTEVTEDGR